MNPKVVLALHVAAGLIAQLVALNLDPQGYPWLAPLLGAINAGLAFLDQSISEAKTPSA